MPKPLAALTLTLALAAPVGLPAQTGPGQPATLTVQGDGEVRARPDIAFIRTGVETEARTAAEALAANSAAAARMIETLKTGGVDARDIQTGQLSVQPVYTDMQHTGRSEGPKVAGYRVVNQVAVTVRDLEALGRLIDRVVQAGANRIDSIGFGLDDDAAQADEARRRAVADARRRAEVLAGAAGVRLVRILSISDSGGIVRPLQAGMMMRAEAMDVPIESGEVAVTASVSILWEIGPPD